MTSGAVVWITGLPSSGKSTLAEQLSTALDARGVKACVLDGDAVRHSLRPSPGYTAQERADFYETLARLAALLSRQGMVVLVPATAHLRAFRERARALASTFYEIWVDTPLEECARRDTKGLYAASRTGQTTTMPGADEAYEPPTAPDLTTHGLMDSAALERFVAHVARALDSGPER